MPRPRAADIDAATIKHRSRIEAQLAGDPLYIGKPCPSGHNGVRFAENSNCVHCNRNRYRESADGTPTMFMLIGLA